MANRKVPRMTRGHYNFIADTIGNLNLTDKQKREVGEAFASGLFATNPRFNRQRFLDYVADTNVRQLRQAAKAMHKSLEAA